METISVVAEVQRRRRFSIRDKLIAVQESNEPGMTVSYVARKYGISPSLLFNWRRRMAQGGKQAIEADDDEVAAGEVRELKRRMRGLYWLNWINGLMITTSGNYIRACG